MYMDNSFNVVNFENIREYKKHQMVVLMRQRRLKFAKVIWRWLMASMPAKTVDIWNNY